MSLSTTNTSFADGVTLKLVQLGLAGAGPVTQAYPSNTDDRTYRLVLSAKCRWFHTVANNNQWQLLYTIADAPPSTSLIAEVIYRRFMLATELTNNVASLQGGEHRSDASEFSTPELLPSPILLPPRSSFTLAIVQGSNGLLESRLLMLETDDVEKLKPYM